METRSQDAARTGPAKLLPAGLGSFSVRSGSLLLGFLVSVTLAHAIGPSGYGTYSFALALVMVMAVPANTSLPQLALRETAKALAENRWGRLRGVWRWTSLAVGLFSALVISLLVLALALDLVPSSAAATVPFALALIPLIALTAVSGGALRGLQHVVLGQVSEALVRPGVLLLLVLAYVVWGGPSLTPTLAMKFHLLAAGSALAAGTFLLMRSRPKEVRASRQVSYQREWLRAVAPFAVAGSFQMITQYADILMLGFFRTDREVGIYRAVLQTAALVTFGLQAVNKVVTPHFARLHTKGDRAGLQRVVTRGARGALLVALPVAIALFVLGGWILAELFGAPFRAGRWALVIAAAGQLASAAFGSVAALLNMTGHERQTVRGVVVAALANIVLNCLLVPPYGMVGAAIAMAASLGIWNTILWRAVRRHLKIEPTAFWPRP